MSLINEALKRAELERQHCSVPSSGPAGDPVSEAVSKAAAAGPGMMPVKAAPAAPGKTRTGLRGALFLAVVVLAGITVVMYFSLPPEQKTPARVRAGHPKSSPAAAEQLQAAPNQLVLRPREQRTAAGSNVDRTLFALADYRPPRTPAPQAAAVTPRSAAPSPQPAPPAPTTQQAQAGQLDPNDFKLGGILRSGDQAHAIINDHLVSVGDEVDGARVVAIQKYHVVLERDGNRLRLRL